LLSNKEMLEKSQILLIALLPIYFLCYALQFIVGGDLFSIEISHLVVWLDIISFAVVEAYLIYSYIGIIKKYKKEAKNN